MTEARELVATVAEYRDSGGGPRKLLAKIDAALHGVPATITARPFSAMNSRAPRGLHVSLDQHYRQKRGKEERDNYQDHRL